MGVFRVQVSDLPWVSDPKRIQPGIMSAQGCHTFPRHLARHVPELPEPQRPSQPDLAGHGLLVGGAG